MSESPEEPKEPPAPAQPLDDLLTLAEAGALLGMTAASVRNYAERGWLVATIAVDGRKLVMRADVMRAKVLRTNDVLAHGVTRAQHLHAVQSRTVEPAANGRLSLEDIETIRCSPTPASPQPFALAPPADRGARVQDQPDAERLTALMRQYHLERWDVADLPPWCWNVPWVPEFDPPTNVARFTYTRVMFLQGGTTVTSIRRSAGWFTSENAVASFEPEDVIDTEPGDYFDPDDEPARYERQNREYQLAKEEWFRCWMKNSSYAQTLTDDEIRALRVPPPRRDRKRAIMRYLQNDQRPCDLPDWFWDLPFCPPFVPPVDVFFRTWGEPVQTSQGWRLVYERSAGWEPTDDPEPTYVEKDTQRTASATPLGPQNAVRERWERQNWDYELVKLEWENEYRLRGPGRRGGAGSPA